MSGIKYTQVKDGEWVHPEPQFGHRTQCCDCGLVHRIDYAVVWKDGKQVVVFRAVRDERATAATTKRRGLLTSLALTPPRAPTTKRRSHPPVPSRQASAKKQKKSAARGAR